MIVLETRWVDLSLPFTTYLYPTITPQPRSFSLRPVGLAVLKVSKPLAYELRGRNPQQLSRIEQPRTCARSSVRAVVLWLVYGLGFMVFI